MTNRITVPVPGLMLGLTLLLALLSGAILAQTASAAGKVPANLRVVSWKGQILYDGKVRTGSVRIKPNANCLGGSIGAARTVTGPTAIGLLIQAARKPSGKAIRKAVRKAGKNAVRRALRRAAGLRPLAISDGDFGFGICGIGGNRATGEQWWSLRNNYRDSTTGAELTTVKRNDSILFYLAKTWNEPTPDALFLRAPARVKRGGVATVRVFAYNGAGRRRPVEGARILGTDARTNARGFARFRMKRSVRLVARSPRLIPSNRVVVRAHR